MKKLIIKEKKDNLLLFLNKNESKFLWGIFLTGFLIDVFTLTKIDYLAGNLVLGSYLILTIFLIILINYGDYYDLKNKFLFNANTSGTALIWK